MRHEETQHMENCFLCRKQFRYGSGAYEGQPVNAWKIIACNSCVRMNHDGIVPATYPHLIAHLEREGIPIPRNASGWIPWPQGVRFGSAPLSRGNRSRRL